MKYFILASIFVLPSTVLACNKKVDPNKVMLFVDTNYSDLEIKTSEKAACDRGERLVVVPKNYKDYVPFISALESTTKKLARCGANDSATCKTAIEDFTRAQQELTKFQTNQKSLQAGVKEALDEIKKSGGKIHQFTISGHDGGGHFGGHKGGFSRYDLVNMMSEYEDLNEVKSLLLLGCYTGTQYEVMQWKNIFPKTKLIGGYDGSAPLSDRPQGHQYIADILSKEQALTAQADNKKLMAFVNSNFKGLNNLNAALYVQCSDGSSIQEYYYGSKKARKFTPMETKECLEKKEEMVEVDQMFQKYFSGELTVPKDTANGELRALYNKARTYEHCAEITGTNIDINGIFNLLFYEGVKQSFADFYKKDIDEAQKILEGFDNEAGVKAAMEQFKQAEESYKSSEDDLNALTEDPEGYLKKQEEELKSLNENFEKMLNDPENASVREVLQAIRSNPYGTTIDPMMYSNPAFLRLLGAMTEVEYKKNAIDQAKNDPSLFIASKRSSLEFQKMNVNRLSQTIGSLKDEKSIWVPTAENLKKYSRKELLENMHRIHKILSLNGASDKQQKALMWISQATQVHLQNFKNPFSWHEFTGRAEAPPQPVRINDMNNFGGMFGGYGLSGGYSPGYGGGFTGGFGGGYSGGYSGGGIAGGMAGGMAGGTLNGGFELPSLDLGIGNGQGQ